MFCVFIPGTQAAYLFMGTHQQKLLCTGIGFWCCPRGSLVTSIFRSLLLILNFLILAAVRYCWMLQLTINFQSISLLDVAKYLELCIQCIGSIWCFWGGLICNFMLCCVCQISPIQSLVGQTGRRWVMGVISQLEDGHFYLEDLTASVEINLSNAISFCASTKAILFHRKSSIILLKVLRSLSWGTRL